MYGLEGLLESGTDSWTILLTFYDISLRFLCNVAMYFKIFKRIYSHKLNFSSLNWHTSISIITKCNAYN